MATDDSLLPRRKATHDRTDCVDPMITQAPDHEPFPPSVAFTLLSSE